ncbi:hypothetical protein [Homoserinibacter gongjuensis]|uniref:hypothetical protein n=1 Tax=Homoserinibacter gongjuensis TaxID=1162968 RepID=UPI0024E05785|nr:hypothetical protein [Homoserinibacter gongjuensis]
MSSLARSRRQLGVLTSVAVVVGLVAGGWMVAEGALSRAADQGVQQGMATRSGADLGLRVTAPLGADPETQDAQVRAAIGRSFAALATPPRSCAPRARPRPCSRPPTRPPRARDSS